MSQTDEIKILRASGTTNVGKLAGSIVACYDESPDNAPTIRIIGAGALNQAVKGVILSNKQFVKRGLIAYILPSFQSFGEVGEEVTSIELKLKISRI